MNEVVPALGPLVVVSVQRARDEGTMIFARLDLDVAALSANDLARKQQDMNYLVVVESKAVAEQWVVPMRTIFLMKEMAMVARVVHMFASRAGREVVQDMKPAVQLLTPHVWMEGIVLVADCSAPSHRQMSVANLVECALKVVPRHGCLLLLVVRVVYTVEVDGLGIGR